MPSIYKLNNKFESNTTIKFYNNVVEIMQLVFIIIYIFKSTVHFLKTGTIEDPKILIL